MGLLDDAIREHLDLKRRRGADPTEVERAEREALGPVRRAPEAPVNADIGDGQDSYDEYDTDLEADSWGHEAPGAEPLAEPNGVGAGPEFLSGSEDEPPTEGAYAATPPPHPVGEETAEYDVEQALDAERHDRGSADEDMLEETPEFLQDTPDHDRLWFEQRPPKDFDFDG